MSSQLLEIEEILKQGVAGLRTYLIKTLLRIPIWILLALTISYFVPSATWVWYVVYLFIAIAVVWSVFLFVRLLRIARLHEELENSERKGDH